MSSSRAMTGFVPTMFTLFPVPHDLLVGPLVRIVQHMRQKIVVAASNFPTRRAMVFHSITTKADGMVKFSLAVRALTPTIGMLSSAPTGILKYIFGLGVVLFLAKLNSRRPTTLLSQTLGCVLLETDAQYLPCRDS